MIRKSKTKSPELMLQEILEKGNVLIKERDILEKTGNQFGVIDGQVDANFIPWALPFFDRLTNEVGFIVWNTKNTNGVTHQIIIDDVKIVNVSKTEFNHWKMVNLGKIDDIKKIVVIENNKIRDEFRLDNEKDIETFKKMSFRHKEIF